jgi:hypothetical protein
MQLCEMRLSHVVHYPHVSTALAVIIRVICKITWCPNRMLNGISEQLAVTKLVSDFLRSHWMSAYWLLKPDKIQIL